MRTIILTLLAWMPCMALFAADGVLEINQACAAGPGCFPGDEPGWPVRLINSGSYILTGDLVVPPLQHGITTQINETDYPRDIRISLDLNGFSISSTTVCSGEPLECSPISPTDAYGVNLSATEDGSFHVHNGTIQGMATAGTNCFNHCIVHDLVVAHNAYYGVSAEGSLRNIYAFRNGQNGIQLFNLGTVSDSVAAENYSGFSGRGVFVGNTARDNPAGGILAADGSVVQQNTVSGSEIGIFCINCSAHNNTVLHSTNAISFENSAGIYGGNIFMADTEFAIINGANAIQSAPNVCNGVACP